MAKFVRTVERMLFNNFGFDIYENEDGTATIIPVKLTDQLPRTYWRSFESLEKLESWLESMLEGRRGANAVSELYDILIIAKDEAIAYSRFAKSCGY